MKTSSRNWSAGRAASAQLSSALLDARSALHIAAVCAAVMLIVLLAVLVCVLLCVRLQEDEQDGFSVVAEYFGRGLFEPPEPEHGGNDDGNTGRLLGGSP
jgi:hypothetical protein